MVHEVRVAEDRVVEAGRMVWACAHVDVHVSAKPHPSAVNLVLTRDDAERTGLVLGGEAVREPRVERVDPRLVVTRWREVDEHAAGRRGAQEG